MRFAPHRTTEPPFYACAGTSTFTFSDSEGSRNNYIAHSEWNTIASSTNENDLGRGDYYLLHGGDFLKISQTTDLRTGQKITCQELWTPIPMCQNQMGKNTSFRPYLLVASIKSGKVKGLIIRLGDYCQGVAHLDGFGFHVERWKRVADSEGSQEWVKDHQSTTWVHQEENICLPGEWLCRDERRIGHGIITLPSSVHTTWYIVEES